MKPIKLPLNTFQTSSVHVAGMLWAIGFRLRKEAPVIRIIDLDTKESFDQFHFTPTAETKWGKISAVDAFKVWRGGVDLKEKAKLPAELVEIIEHIAAAQQNRTLMIAAVKKKIEEGQISQYTRQKVEGNENAVAIMPLNASEELYRKMEHMMEEF